MSSRRRPGSISRTSIARCGDAGDGWRVDPAMTRKRIAPKREPGDGCRVEPGMTSSRAEIEEQMCGAELTSLPEGVQRVARLLQEQGHPHAPVMLDDAARTAQQAADALGIHVGQIAKSIIFKRKSDNVAVLVVTSGDRRVDEKKVDALVGKTGRADADFVKSATGFSIGG